MLPDFQGNTPAPHVIADQQDGGVCRVLIDGDRVRGEFFTTRTPDELELEEDGDTIDILLGQGGPGSFPHHEEVFNTVEGVLAYYRVEVRRLRLVEYHAGVNGNVDQAAAIAQRDAIIANRDAAISGHAEQMQMLQAALSDREAAITDRETTIAHQTATIADCEATLADRNTVIATRESAIAELDANLSSKDAALEEHLATITQLRAHQSLNEAELRELQAERMACDESLERLRHENARLRQENGRLKTREREAADVERQAQAEEYKRTLRSSANPTKCARRPWCGDAPQRARRLRARLPARAAV